MAEKRRVQEAPSETALFAALRRALAHKSYQNERFGSDELAVYFLPAHFRFFLGFQKVRANTINRLDSAMPGLSAYMIARTAYFDRLFRDALHSQISQLVLLGAGYDTRAFRFSRANHATRIFELDSLPTQARKIACLRKARIEIPGLVAFVPIDFNREPLQAALEGAGWRSDQKTFFLWEGVSYYLEREAVDATLRFVSQHTDPGSAIAFDYTVAVSPENEDAYYGAREFARSMREHHSGEQILFSIPEGEADSFLAQRGLAVVEHLDKNAIEEQFLRDEHGSLIGQMTGHFRFVVAAPHKQ